MDKVTQGHVDMVAGPYCIRCYTDATVTTGQAIALTVYQQALYIYLSDGTNTSTATVTLPPVAEAAGRVYTIRVPDFSGGVTIQDQDDSLEWSDLTVNADGEYAVLYSDGRQWSVLKTDI